ncbi:glycerophosphoryl diester phosphodiesterase [Virgisporangium aliadipatigenens]|uniref:Glycerophosphoryl diester phosphodiesterase n=1 Tax=Virgisporangium aliadipatigenens TaxID=741659 RepID=A0A8J4DUM8_9ACTN|nr:glycerophosphodiester phosphodiesterase family protein [Virgisporangium aliadipatigenens]GIJ51475.1 glycerophosphoryl diester phosphodiesterase [Virgisporangium aliadipatigenens]
MPGPSSDPELPGSGAAPLVIAHRGASDELPEHTLEAYLRAIEDGADGVECDVRLSRDGHLVCVHDRRLNRTSNGRGLVRRRTLAELEQLDFGSWHAAEQPAPVLTLETLLGAVRDAGRPLRLLVETKHPTLGGRLIEPTLAELLRKFALDRPEPGDAVSVTMMSFSPLALQRMRELAPDVPRVFLMDHLPPGVYPPAVLPYGAAAGGPGVSLLRARPAIAERLRRNGNEVYVWTVNDPADVDLCVRLGVRAIITDRPGFVRRHLAGGRRTGDDGNGPGAADSGP